VAALFTPMLGVWVLKKPKTAHAEEHGPIMRAFRAFLALAMRARWVTISATLVVFGVAVYGMRFVPQQFFPASDRPELLVDMQLPESGQVIPVSFRGKKGSYTHCMFLNDGPPIAAGRELWGFPKKLAQLTLRAEIDTLVGGLDYGPVRVGTGTIGYKHKAADPEAVLASLAAPNYLLKIIPHVDGSPRICELVEYYLEDIELKGAWTEPGALDLHAHALAPVAELPVLEVIAATHIIADLTLGLGKVVYDYLRQPAQRSVQTREMSYAS
jgi:acetoacetate decarboxylase